MARVVGRGVGLGLLLLLTACGGGSEITAMPSTLGGGGDGSASASASTAATSSRSCTSTKVPYPKTLVQDGSYVIEPDQWNASGTLCLETPGDTGFTISQVKDMQPRTFGSPGAYANIATASGALGLPMPVSALGDATVDWSASAGVTGSYDLAFDVWYGPSAGDCASSDSAELMIWMDATDNVQPAGSAVSEAASVGGTDYRVFQAVKTNAHTVISYVRTVPSHTAHGLDLRLFTSDALQRGYVPSQSYLCKVSAGFELWSGGVGLRTTSFAFHNAVGLPSGQLRSDARGECLTQAANGAVGDGGCGTAGPWTLAGDGTLRSGGKCLQAESALSVAACDGSSAQRWSTGSARQIVSAKTGECLSAGASGGAVSLAGCDGSAAQHWAVPYNGVS